MGFIFNTVKSTLKLCIKLVLYFLVFATIIVLIPNLPPYTKFTSIELSPPVERVGVLAPNKVLNNAAQRYKGKLLGPEAFQVFNGELYTSLATGEIVKISPGGHVTFVTKLGLPCTGLSKEHICGRPLDFEIDERTGTLYVADAYYGIWKVDLKTDKKQLLVSPRVEIEKRQPKLFNSITLAKNGDFYWTDSSSDLQLRDGALVSLLDPSGRLFYYNALKNESKVLAEDLWFPNGVVMYPSNEFLVISESCRYRLLKHYIAGPNKGKTEAFVDLPGVPDNIRVLPDGSGLLVGLYIVFDEEHPALLRSMASTPHARKFLARLQRLIEIPFEYLNNVYPHVIFEDIVYYIGHFNSIMGVIPPTSGLVQVDWNGKVVAAYYNTDKSLGHISDGIVYNNELHMGSPHQQDFIGVVPAPTLLKKAFETVKKVESPKVDAKKTIEQAKAKIEEKPKAAPKPKIEVNRDIPKQEIPKTTPPPPKTTTTPPPRTTQPPPTTTARPPTTTPSPPPKTTPSPPPKTTPSPPPKTTPSPPPKTTPSPPPKTTPPPPPKTTPSPPPKTTPSPPPKSTTPADSKAPSQTKEQHKPTPKPEIKSTTAPRKETTTPMPPQGKLKEEIPIKEEIPLDTTRPPKETLKVIKKGGVPTEIPVPNL